MPAPYPHPTHNSRAFMDVAISSTTFALWRFLTIWKTSGEKSLFSIELFADSSQFSAMKHWLHVAMQAL